MRGGAATASVATGCAAMPATLATSAPTDWRATGSRRRVHAPPRAALPPRQAISAKIDNAAGTTLKLLQQGVAARDFDLARRFFDIELLHHPVLDQHGLALRALSGPIAHNLYSRVRRLGKIA